MLTDWLPASNERGRSDGRVIKTVPPTSASSSLELFYYVVEPGTRECFGSYSAQSELRAPTGQGAKAQDALWQDKPVMRLQPFPFLAADHKFTGTEEKVTRSPGSWTLHSTSRHYKYVERFWNTWNIWKMIFKELLMADAGELSEVQLPTTQPSKTTVLLAARFWDKKLK